MRQIYAGVAAVFALGSVIAGPACATPEPVANHWYARLGDGPWCAYASQKTRDSISDAGTDDHGNFYQSANAVIANGEAQRIFLTSSDESGDWIVYDDYVLIRGQISRLERKYNGFGAGSLVQVFVVKGGKMVRQSQDLYELGRKTRKPMRKGVDYGPHIAIISDIKKPGSTRSCWQRQRRSQSARGKKSVSTPRYCPLKRGR